LYTDGTIISPIPATAPPPLFFVLDDPAFGPAGVVTYGGATAPDFGAGSVSSAGWLVNDTMTSPYSFANFYERFGSPSDNLNASITLADLAEGVNYSDSDLLITVGGNVGTTVPISLLVDGNLTIQDDITVDVGAFFGAFTSGNINLEGAVSELEGVYFTDATFDTCSAGSCDNDLDLEGSFTNASLGLNRDLSDNDNSAEAFHYRSDFVLNAPLEIWRTPQTWEELPP
jgi:hypothetical protein